MDQNKTGRFIAECRKNMNYTQDQLAEKIGVSKNAVSKWERGINLPDASLMQELCGILNISLNELFSGEKIPDHKYKEIADHNLYSALEDSVFTLKDKVDYLKKKWDKEHCFTLLVIMIIIVCLIIVGFVKDNGMQYVFMIVGFIIGFIEERRKMTYIEKSIYGDKLHIAITSEEFHHTLNSFKEAKHLISGFTTKKEAVDYLIKETGLSKRECADAYDIIIKLDFDKIDEDLPVH